MTDRGPTDLPQSPAPAGDAVRLDAVVRGRVQGVGFRVHVARTATGLGLTGWVANESDGAVRCVAEGPRVDLERLLDGLRAGPSGSLVRDVTVGWRPATGGQTRFEIRSRGHSGD